MLENFHSNDSVRTHTENSMVTKKQDILKKEMPCGDIKIPKLDSIYIEH